MAPARLYAMCSVLSSPESRFVPETVHVEPSPERFIDDVMRWPGCTSIAGAVTTGNFGCFASTNHDCSAHAWPCSPYWSTGCSTGYPISGSVALKPGQK